MISMRIEGNMIESRGSSSSVEFEYQVRVPGLEDWKGNGKRDEERKSAETIRMAEEGERQ